jgi:hypothetical protein
MSKIGDKIKALCKHLERHGAHEAQALRVPLGIKDASPLCQRAVALGLATHDNPSANSRNTSIPRRYSVAEGWRDEIARLDARGSKRISMAGVSSVWDLGRL